MEKLLEVLRRIEAQELDLNDEEAAGLACELLITEGGGCNWGNIRVLRESGFRVFAGEKDSFGWLTGCIQTTQGIIIYG